MKTTKQAIGEYIQRKDILGLVDYFRAYLEDEVMDKEKIIKEIERRRDKAKEYKEKYDEWEIAHKIFRGREETCDDIINWIKEENK